MAKAYIFPGQGSQHLLMGKPLYETVENSKRIFDLANDILGYSLTDVMFNGSKEDLTETNITQPAIFTHSIAALSSLSNFDAKAVAGHSLGEFSALVAAECLSFEDGLQLVHQRAVAMKRACESTNGTMAAVLGLEDLIVEQVCNSVEGIVVAANYNCPGQLVISGDKTAIDIAVEKLKKAGAKRAIILQVDGAFHSPLMQSAQEDFSKAIDKISFAEPKIPIYQNVSAKAETSPEVIKENLKQQLVQPVRWTASVQQMIADGFKEFTEIGPGKTLQGLVRKIDRSTELLSIG